MPKPLVTVVTVTYNLINADRTEDFKQCLESVQNQTYENIEHIVIDGASTDGTVDLIKQYEAKGWIKYISEPDTGLYDAMNKGAKMAQGKYIIFLNSDDYFSGEEGIEKSVEALEKTGADYSYTGCKIIDFDGINIASWHWQNKPDFAKVFTYMPFCHQTLMVKTEVFIKNGMFDLKYKSAGDYDFVLRLTFNKFKPVYVPYEFVTFKLGGYSKDNEEVALNEILDFYNKYYSKLCKLSLEDCKNIHETKHIPPRLLIKLLPLVDKATQKKLVLNKHYHKTLFKNFRKKLFRMSLSKTNPYFTLLGIEIVKPKKV